MTTSKTLMVLGLLLLSTSLYAALPSHLPLDLSFEEYQKLWSKEKYLSMTKGSQKALTTETRQAIDGGERLSLWLEKINQSRSSDDQIRLTSPGTRRGIPIDKPSKYGPSTIKKDLNELLSSLPAEMKNTIYGKLPLSSQIPSDMDTETFIELARKVKRLYGTAVRWTTAIEPYLPYYKLRKSADVRGIYTLRQMDSEELNEKLRHYDTLDKEEQKTLRDALLGLCLNDGITSPSTCSRRFAQSRGKGFLVAFKDDHWMAGIKKWDSFYEITNPRNDVVWNSSHPDLMIVTFKDPGNDRIRDFLKDNIEDEFQHESWGLRMDFVTSGWGVAYLKFEAGVTPHVTQGNIIVMDANSPIEEYDVQWTIRHEYGHILRMPDCYVEFYDSEEELAINYQLDVTDLMCSRAGDMNERIYKELKRVYFRK